MTTCIHNQHNENFNFLKKYCIMIEMTGAAVAVTGQHSCGGPGGFIRGQGAALLRAVPAVKGQQWSVKGQGQQWSVKCQGQQWSRSAMVSQGSRSAKVSQGSRSAMVSLGSRVSTPVGSHTICTDLIGGEERRMEGGAPVNGQPWTCHLHPPVGTSSTININNNNTFNN